MQQFYTPRTLYLLNVCTPPVYACYWTSGRLKTSATANVSCSDRLPLNLIHNPVSSLHTRMVGLYRVVRKKQARREGGVKGLATPGPATFGGPGVGQKYKVRQNVPF